MNGLSGRLTPMPPKSKKVTNQKVLGVNIYTIDVNTSEALYIYGWFDDLLFSYVFIYFLSLIM